MNLGDGKLKLLGTGLAALWLTLGWQGAPADAITVTPANPTIGVGQTQQFTANGALTPTAVAAGGHGGGSEGSIRRELLRLADANGGIRRRDSDGIGGSPLPA